MKKIYFTTSWDDGDKLDLKLLNLMNKYGIKGTFYIPGNSKLEKSDIQNIAKNQEIGAHTMTHRELTSISIKEAKKEIENSKLFLEKILNKKIESFCYPRGKYNLEISRLVKKAGFSYARTTKRLLFKNTKNPFINGTTTQTIVFKVDIFKLFIMSRFNPFFIRYIWDWNYYMKLLYKYVSKNGGIVHLWGHSWEIDKFNQWDQLEDFFKFISSQKNVLFITNYEVLKNA